MRALHVVTRMNVGGVSTLVRNLAEGLPQHDVEVILATGEVQDGEVEVADLPARVVRIPGLGRAPRPGEDLRALTALRSLVRRTRPDVLHTHTAKAGALGRAAVEGLHVKRIHTFHGTLLRGYFTPRLARAVALTERALALRTDLLISSGVRVQADLRAAGVGLRTPWVNVPPGVHPPTPSGRSEGRTVAYVGRLVPVKRVDRLLAAARLLPDTRFLVAGDGPLRPELEASAPANVEFLGWVADTGTVYGRADLVLLCSENEAMPLALLEGALCGLPGVTTDVGSAAEVVAHGRTGIVTGSRPEELAAAVSALLDDEPWRTAAGEAARRHALCSHTVNAMCAAHAVAYRRVTPLT